MCTGIQPLYTCTCMHVYHFTKEFSMHPLQPAELIGECMVKWTTDLYKFLLRQSRRLSPKFVIFYSCSIWVNQYLVEKASL